MYSDKYAASVVFIVPAALLAVGMSLCCIVMNYLFAMGKLGFFTISCALGCALGTAAAYLLRGHGIGTIALALAAAYLAIFLANAAHIALGVKNSAAEVAE
jgi:uncharacterized membrane protein